MLAFEANIMKKCRECLKYHGFAGYCFPPKRTFKLLGHVIPFGHWRLVIIVDCWLGLGGRGLDYSANKLDGNVVQNSDITGSIMTADLME